jgi:SAM-dependent methyltransferase
MPNSDDDGYHADVANSSDRAVFFRSCNFCGGTRFRVFHRADTAFPERIYGDSELSDPDVGRVLRLQYLECAACGLVGISPLPHFRDIHRASFDGERNLVAWADIDWSHYEQDKLTTTRIIYDVYRFESYRKSNRLLDVSCGPGVSLSWLTRAKGWDAMGVDPDRHSVRTAKERYGLEIRNGLLQDLDAPDGHFDLLVMDNSLEHCFDPLRTLLHAYRLLRAEGGLFIAVPNSHGLSTRVLNLNAHWGHWFLFSPAVLWAVLRRIGFRVTRIFARQMEEKPELVARGVDPAHYRAALDVDLRGELETERILGMPAVSDFFHVLAERPAGSQGLSDRHRELEQIADSSLRERDSVDLAEPSAPRG